MRAYGGDAEEVEGLLVEAVGSAVAELVTVVFVKGVE